MRVLDQILELSAGLQASLALELLTEIQVPSSLDFTWLSLFGRLRSWNRIRWAPQLGLCTSGELRNCYLGMQARAFLAWF